MNRRISLLLACLMLAPFLSAQSIHYTVSLANPAKHLVHVKLDIPAGDATRELQLPTWNATYQIRDFSQYVNWVRARDSANNPLPLIKLTTSRWRIEQASQGATIDYEIFADNSPPFGAQLNDHHAFFNLAELLMYPVDQRSTPIRIGFTDLPAGWKVATALLESAGEFSAENYDRLVDSPFEIGSFRESDFDEGGGHYRVIIDADPADYDLQKIVDTDRAVAKAETSWMNDRPFDTYVFIYHLPRGSAGGGMEHAYSTAIGFSASRLGEDYPRFVGVTAHEFFHLWNVKRIRPQSLEPIDYANGNLTRALWFSEGVTTTGANYAMLHGGVLSAQAFLKNLADEITELQGEPAHLTQSAEESSLETWLDKYDYYREPQRSISYYNKGFLLGVLLDLQIREDSHGAASLRDLFQWMNQNYPQKGRFFADSEGVREAAERFSHSDLRPFFQKYVSGTDEIPWDDFFRTVGLHLVRTVRQAGDPGFSVSRSRREAVTVLEVAPGGGAEKASLVVGDVVLQANGKTNPSDIRRALDQATPGEELNLKVRSITGERELHWKLASKEQVELELKDIDNLTQAQRDRRAAWLKGESQTGAQP